MLAVSFSSSSSGLTWDKGQKKGPKSWTRKRCVLFLNFSNWFPVWNVFFWEHQNIFLLFPLSSGRSHRTDWIVVDNTKRTRIEISKTVINYQQLSFIVWLISNWNVDNSTIECLARATNSTRHLTHSAKRRKILEKLLPMVNSIPLLELLCVQFYDF